MAKAARRIAFKVAAAAERRAALVDAHAAANGTHFRRALSVAAATKVAAQVAHDEAQRACATKAALATARRLGSPTGEGRATKAGAHFRRAREAAAAAKTAKVEAKDAVARRLQFKADAATARREALLQGASAKSGAHVHAVLVKASKAKARFATLTKENRAKCAARLARAANRRAVLLSSRVANAAPRRTMNGRRSNAALAC